MGKGHVVLAVAALALAVPVWAEQVDLEPYGYQVQGRRDPFVASPQGDQQTPFDALALRGVVRTPTGFLGMLAGPDGRAYVVRNGERLLDGRVLSVDATSVRFQPDGASRQVVKSLHPETDAAPIFR